MTTRFPTIVIFSVLLLVFPLQGARASSDDPVALNTIFESPLNTADGTGFLDRIFAELFRRMGLTVIRRRVAAERSMLNLNQGIDDATTLRIGGLTNLYPDIRQVPEKVMDFEFVAFTTGLKLPVSGWKSLRPFNVGIITGWKILEANVTETQTLVKVDNALQLFQLLGKGRADTVIYEKWEGLHMARQLGMDDIRVLDPPLATRAMYPYVYVERRDLIPGMAATLKRMKADGTLEEISDQTLKPLIADRD